MKILGENIHFRENIEFSFHRYTVWWAILFVTMAVDIFTTYTFVSKYGIQAEGNFFTRTWMSYVGPHAGNVIGKFLQLLSVIFFVGLHKRLGNIVLLLIILINCWAIVINSWSLVT